MPRYDFRCPQGHVNEAVTPMAVSSRPCPCGAEAVRVAVYADQTIIGDTVPKGAAKRGIVDKNGRTNVGLFQEASAEVAYAEDKAGVKGSSLYQVGKQRAREMGVNIG